MTEGNVTTTPGLQAHYLRCEHRRNPLGVDAARPRLSWVLESEERGQKQSAYQILVAGNEDDLRTEENLLWDSGKVASDRTLEVEYEGQEPRSGSRCSWKVRVWDGLGNPSPYSETAIWEMGFLETFNWTGKRAARAGYASIRGRITSKWEISDGTFRLSVRLPANTRAEVCVPASNRTGITESSRPLNRAEDVELLRREEGEAVVAVGSGSYEFVGSMR